MKFAGLVVPVGLALFLVASPTHLAGQAAPAGVPRATLAPASPLLLPGTVDSNSPALWDLEDGLSRIFVMTSSDGAPRLASGRSVSRLDALHAVTFTSHPGNGLWMEAVVADAGGTWYGYYHNENPAVGCGRADRAIARIGAARSTDRGRTWQNLGIIIETPTESVACNSPNRYVIGGVGDLSVMLNSSKTYLYIFYSQYQKQAATQGVAVARMTWANRDQPVRRVQVWTEGVWMGSRINRTPTTDVTGVRRNVWVEYPAGTPLVATSQAWHDADGKVDAFWGPSVHWNESIQSYVMLLNRAKDENYTQEGIYVSFAPRLDDPRLWSAPTRLLAGGRWYPQVVGLETGIGSDKSAGASARFFMSGRSDHVISFTR